MTTGFGSLAVRDGRLWLRPDRRHGARLRFEPTALMVVHHGDETAMPWEEYRGSERGEGWHCVGTPGTRYNRPAVTVAEQTKR